jgi:hypothetical protein
METSANKQLILSLIRDDLINLRLIHGLHHIGIDASIYMLHLGETILDLLDYPDSLETDAVYDEYYKQTQRASDIDISQSHAPLDGLAQEIYDMLEIRRKNIS